MRKALLFVSLFYFGTAGAYGADAFTRGMSVAVVNMLVCETYEQGSAILNALKTGGEKEMTRVFGELHSKRDASGQPQCTIHLKPVRIRVIEAVDTVPIPKKEAPQESTMWYIIKIYSLIDRKVLFLLSVLPVQESEPSQRGRGEYRI